MKRRLGPSLLFVGTLLPAIAVACGGDSGSAGAPPTPTTIEVTADELRFNPGTIEVPAGQMVTLRLVNEDDMEHDLEVQGLMPRGISGGAHGDHGGSATSVAVHTQAGETASVEFQAEDRGTYEVFCTVPGHKELGMVAELVVN